MSDVEKIVLFAKRVLVEHPTLAILTDIEGTIGDIAFVRNVLFPYARERLATFLGSQSTRPEVRAIVEDVRREAGLSSGADVVKTLEAWIDADKKATPLKALQGMIWREGYESGVLKAHLYDDVVPAFKFWLELGRSLWSYSSGSVEAQELYYRYSTAGDVLPMFSGCFDTTIGPKGDPQSYVKIAAKIGLNPRSVGFLSDAPAEVLAANRAGMVAFRIDRGLSPDGVSTDGDGGVVLGSLKRLAELPVLPHKSS